MFLLVSSPVLVLGLASVSVSVLALRSGRLLAPGFGQMTHMPFGMLVGVSPRL